MTVAEHDEILRAAEIGATLARFNKVPLQFLDKWCKDELLLAKFKKDGDKYFYPTVVEAVENYSQVHCPHCGEKRR